MSDANKERAAFRLVEMLTPAAALGIKCPKCPASVGVECAGNPPFAIHVERYDAARAELHSLLLTLGLGT